VKEKYNSILFFVINTVVSFIHTSDRDDYNGMPLIFEITKNRIQLDFENYQQYNIEMQDKTVIINQNKILVLPIPFLFDLNFPTHNYKEISSFNNIINIPIDNPDIQESLIFINFVNSPVYTKTYINYQKTENIFSNIGGLIGLQLPLLEIICCFIVAPFYEASRINSVFKFHQNLECDKNIDHYINSFLKHMPYSKLETNTKGN